MCFVSKCVQSKLIGINQPKYDQPSICCFIVFPAILTTKSAAKSAARACGKALLGVRKQDCLLRSTIAPHHLQGTRPGRDDAPPDAMCIAVGYISWRFLSNKRWDLVITNPEYVVFSCSLWFTMNYGKNGGFQLISTLEEFKKHGTELATDGYCGGRIRNPPMHKCITNIWRDLCLQHIAKHSVFRPRKLAEHDDPNDWAWLTSGKRTKTCS